MNTGYNRNATYLSKLLEYIQDSVIAIILKVSINDALYINMRIIIHIL